MSKFPSGRELPSSPVAGVYGENLSATHDERVRERQRAWGEYRRALALHHGLVEVSLDDISPVGTTGRRFEVKGQGEFWTDEALYADHEDPKSGGAELFVVGADGRVTYLRRSLGSLRPVARPLSDATITAQFTPAPTHNSAISIQ